MWTQTQRQNCGLANPLKLIVYIDISFYIYVWAFLENAMATPPVLLPGKSHGRRGLVGCSPWGREESDMTK